MLPHEPVSGLIDLLIEARPRDLGGFSVRRALPATTRRLVGPFIFFDQMGPMALEVGKGLDVRPHPHIALATVTYLFAGEIDHKDSLGSDLTIRPGDVNWMVAGKGIAHSERSSASSRASGVHLHGIQSWVALPKEHEESEPSFAHHPKSTLPRLTEKGVTLDVIAGTAYGATSPVSCLSPTFYVHALLEAGAKVAVEREHQERAIFVVEGTVRVDGVAIHEGTMAVLVENKEAFIEADTSARVMLLGGEKLDGERHIFWNFVSSSKERIERAKDDWKNDRFPRVPGDNERIPLPEDVPHPHA